MIANFTSFFDSALLAVGVTDALLLFYDNRPFLEKLMDILLDHQQRVMQAVCDRFGDELAFVLVNDDIAHQTGLLIHPRMFREIFPAAHEATDRAGQGSWQAGSIPHRRQDRPGPADAVRHRLRHRASDRARVQRHLAAFRQQWAGKMAFVGNIPTLLLAYGRPDEIDERVRHQCVELAPGGGYVLGSSPSIMEGIPPENFLAMIQAVHRYGRYGRLGQAEAGSQPVSPLQLEQLLARSETGQSASTPTERDG